MDAAAEVARIPVLEMMEEPGRASMMDAAFCFGAGSTGVEKALTRGDLDDLIVLAAVDSIGR